MPVNNLNLPAGTPLMIGAPAHPMDPSIFAAIANLIASIDGVAEAHLPQLFAVGVMDRPAQVLVLLLRAHASIAAIRTRLEEGLSEIIGPDRHLHLLPMLPDNPLLDDIRLTACRVFPAYPGAGGASSAN